MNEGSLTVHFYLLILLENGVGVGFIKGGILVTIFDFTSLSPFFFHGYCLIPELCTQSRIHKDIKGRLIHEKLDLLDLIRLNEAPRVDENTSVLGTLLLVVLVETFHEWHSLGNVVCVADGCGPRDEDRLVRIRVIIEGSRILSICNTHEQTECNRTEFKHD